MENRKNILIGCTGSVATIKLPVVLNQLKKRDPLFNVSDCSLLTERNFLINFQYFHIIFLDPSGAH